MAEGLDRKKRIRAAHCASATRNVNGAYDLIKASEVNLAKLRQAKQTLTVKLKTLADCDTQILELTDLENEIEQADLTREKITLCIIDIDGAIDLATRGAIIRTLSESVRTEPVRTGGTTDSGASTGHEHPTTGETGGSRETESATGGGGTSPSRSPTPPPLTPPERITSGPSAPGVKLPKLTIRKFGGELTKWVSFWDSFESAIHNNPTLTAINYLKSYLDSTAADAIAGLTLTAVNYVEAIETLKRRFGNTQLIVNKHMEGLLGLPAVSSQHEVRDLRHLYDAVESYVRGLRALGVSAESYGGMLTSILMNKLPAEIRLIVNCELTDDTWSITDILKSVEKEVRIRERAAESGGANSRGVRRSKPPATASSLLNNSSGQVQCSFCNGDHTSSSCPRVTGVDAQKEILRKSGRCFVCLRKNHISRNCRSSLKCNACNGRHHVSICPNRNTRTPVTTPNHEDRRTEEVTSTNLSVGAHTPILLQTVSTAAMNPDDASICAQARFILDGGSQRTYITLEAKERLQLPTERKEIIIKTFGSNEKSLRDCDVVKVDLQTKKDGVLRLDALVVPFICDPLMCQPTSETSETYLHLDGLELADPISSDETLQADMLVGSDHYWRIVTGRTRRGGSGPVTA